MTKSDRFCDSSSDSSNNKGCNWNGCERSHSTDSETSCSSSESLSSNGEVHGNDREIVAIQGDKKTPVGEESPLNYDEIKAIADFLLSKTMYRCQIGIICGSGLSELGNLLENRTTIHYEDIPHFPVSTVVGHKGQMVIGLLKNVPVVCMQGRFHPYEGYPTWKCALPVRVLHLMGVKSLIISNAAGSLMSDHRVGDIMIIKDHISMPGLAGRSPLVGSNDNRFGTRFPSMQGAYNKKYREYALKIGEEIGLKDNIHEGVYCMNGGPVYETPAECRMLLNTLNINAVGMSTVPEVVVARHCGMLVFAFSLISNKCVMDTDSENSPNHAEVVAACASRKSDLKVFVERMVLQIYNDLQSLPLENDKSYWKLLLGK
ncbi:purine nucleoside phosphorylase-like [Artemia franciscana]